MEIRLCVKDSVFRLRILVILVSQIVSGASLSGPVPYEKREYKCHNFGLVEFLAKLTLSQASVGPPLRFRQSELAPLAERLSAWADFCCMSIIILRETPGDIGNLGS